jgi:ribosomal protein L24
MPSQNKHEQIKATSKKMLYDVCGRMGAVCDFKMDYKSQLGDIEVKFDNYDNACEFIEYCRLMVKYCKDANKYLDDYMEWLFDNSDGMPEGVYVEQMDICKKLKDVSMENKDEEYITVQMGIACNQMMALNNKLANMSEKKRNKIKKKPVKWDKLKAFIDITIEENPDAPIEDFFEELKWISYSKINLTFEGDVKYVRDIGMALYNKTH